MPGGCEAGAGPHFELVEIDDRMIATCRRSAPRHKHAQCDRHYANHVPCHAVPRLRSHARIADSEPSGDWLVDAASTLSL